MNVDRISRDRLVNAIERFLNDETTAFQFDQEIHEILAASSDPTVRHVVRSLWSHYDDCRDHPMHLCKEEWDYFQRLILLLKSDAHLKLHRQQIWSGLQAVAGLVLVVYCLCAWTVGFGRDLLFLTLPLGIVALGISELRRRARQLRWRTCPVPVEARTSMFPFTSLCELIAVRRQVLGFTKQRYRPELKSRRIRTPSRDWILRLQWGVVFLTFAPLVLFAQVFPEAETRSTVELHRT